MCVIVYAKINGKTFLAKNRDRAYKPKVIIIHELIDGIEIAYMVDLVSGWIEGINEYGIAMVNSSLKTTFNKETIKLKKLISKDPYYFVMHNNKSDNFYRLLQEKDIDADLEKCLKDANKCKDIAEGHTLLCSNDDCFHIEYVHGTPKKTSILIDELKDVKLAVFSNHGVKTDEGYQSGIKGLSSYLRRQITEENLKNNKIASGKDLIKFMNTYYEDLDPRFQSYRDETTTKKILKRDFKTLISTASQTLFNVSDKIFDYYTDTNNQKFLGYYNILPKNYEPKITVNVHKIKKNLTPRKLPLSTKQLDRIYSKFHLKKIKKTRKNKLDSTNKNNHKNNKNKTIRRSYK